MSYTFIVSATDATVVNLKTGNTTTVSKTDGVFEQFSALIKRGKYEEAERLGDRRVAVTEYAKESVAVSSGVFEVIVENNSVKYKFAGMGPYELHNAIVDRILKLQEQGFSIKPLVSFMVNLLSNPSKTAINEAYLFAEQNGLPITEDGYMVAYKIVGNDYMDLYSHTIRNMVGDKPEMKREDVDDDRNRTCSVGLHFCSKGYLPHYGNTTGNSDRCMIVKIHPADIVAIPNDYQNAKGRAWRYEVIGEVTEGNWRQTLSKKDYTDVAVVDTNTGAPKATVVDRLSMEDVWDQFFDVDNGFVYWVDTGNDATKDHVVNKLMKKAGVSFEAAEEFMNAEIANSLTFLAKDEMLDDIGEEDEVAVPVNKWPYDESSFKKNSYHWKVINDYGIDYDFQDHVWFDLTRDGTHGRQIFTDQFVADTCGFTLNEIRMLTNQ